MPGQGLQLIPFRIPEKWDAAWYARHLQEVLALADVRNAIEGSGITISGQPGEQATISTSDDLQNLLLQTFVLAQPSGFLEFERTLAGEAGVIQIIDGGADANITVELIDNGVTLGKLKELSSMGILGNPVDDVGEIQNIQPEADGDVLTRQGTDLLFTNAPTWTGNHRWLDSLEVQLGTDGDFGLSHDGTDALVRNETGSLVFMLGAVERFVISQDGEFFVDGDEGGAGEVLTSAGPGLPPTWEAGGGGANWYFEPPEAADFPNAYSGDAGALGIADDADVGLILSGLFDSGANIQRIRTKALPSAGATDWSVTALLRFTWPASAPAGSINLCAYENATGKIVHWGQLSLSNAYVWRANNLATFTAIVANTTWTLLAEVKHAWLRVRYDHASTTYFFDYSSDGKSFINFTSVGAATAFTTRADEVGFSFQTANAGGATAYMSCANWQQSW